MDDLNREPLDDINRQRGAVLVLAALLLLALLGFAALAVDVGHITVVKNELQNAADAGALAGADQLYFVEAGSPVPVDLNDVGRLNPEAGLAAEVAAEKNSSVKIPVEVTLSGNSANSDVQIGHWNLSGRVFTRYTGTLSDYDPVDLFGKTMAELDDMNGQGGNPFLINAVLTRTHRRDTPAPSFFSKIFGYSDFGVTAEAVAYLGFAGSFRPGDFDWPIAICEESILSADGEFTCGQGRLINSSSSDSANTGAWTNYQSCTDSGGTLYDNINPFNANDLSDIFSTRGQDDCDGSNANTIVTAISVGGGQVGGSYNDMTTCTEFDHQPNQSPTRTQPWEITLPVIDCDGTPGSGTTTGGPIGGCKQLTGAVTIEVVLVTDEFTGKDKYDSLPRSMGDWSFNPALTGEENWRSFVSHFDLRVNGAPATSAEDLGFYQTTIYALPSCKPQPPIGRTGGTIPSIMAADPVLVKGTINY